MNKLKALKIGVVVIRIALGLLFIYGGTQKFIPKPKKASTEQAQVETPENVVKIKAFIGGMKKSGYFWQFLGTVEILCGILLLSQYLSLLGAVMLIPLTLNIFLFHLFLEPDELGELTMTGLYFIANIALLAYDYPQLKHAFLKQKRLI